MLFLKLLLNQKAIAFLRAITGSDKTTIDKVPDDFGGSAVKLTLITATHHRVAKLAEAALPSVLGQTEQNFELLTKAIGAIFALR